MSSQRTRSSWKNVETPQERLHDEEYRFDTDPKEPENPDQASDVELEPTQKPEQETTEKLAHDVEIGT